MTASLRRAGARPRSRLAGAALSFLWPGLGQWYQGRNRAAVLFAAPVVLLAALLAISLASGLTTFAVRLLDPSFSLTLLVLIALVGAWRLLAIVDAALPRGQATVLGRRSAAILGLLLVLVVGMHGLAGYYAYAFHEAGSKIFVGDRPDTDTPQPSTGSSPAPSDDYDVPPFSTPGSDQARVTILLTGIDKNTERSHSLTDTLLVVSVDPASGAVAMISFPRDLAQFPLYSGGTYAGKINSLMSYAARNPREFPDGPLPTVAKQLGFLLGIDVNYFAAVDLDGFQRMIEAVGGVTVDVERAIADPMAGLFLPAGPQHLDAATALAFVRSRYGAGDSDFTRASRQQQLLVALRAKLTDPANFDKIPAVLEAASETIRTNFPPERLDQVFELARLGGSGIERVVLQPPKYSVHPPTSSTGGTYILRLRWNAVRALSVQLFGEDSAFWTGEFDPAGSPIPLPAP